MDFPNTSELELLLSHATGLKALTLGNIYFGNPSVRGVDPPGVHVFLESLELELEMEAVDAIVSGFSTVDIKHLKSLVTKFSPIIPLLKFGHLCHLKVLKTISLDFADRVKYVSSNTEDWTKLDAILSQAVDGLEDIHLHTEHPLDAGLIRSLLPSVGRKIGVHVHKKVLSGASEGL
ncbi:hypothetical protein C8J57DRAFT_1232637 [Mycena rebaudengoi]|nr:hypothetical protein C8J57DRAFT_1232637 [Mycena rebaudengoi]